MALIDCRLFGHLKTSLACVQTSAHWLISRDELSVAVHSNLYTTGKHSTIKCVNATEGLYTYERLQLYEEREGWRGLTTR